MSTNRKPIEVWMRLKNPKKLAKLMAIEGYSARRLAEEVGWKSHTYMQRLVRGDASTLKPEPAILIARCLDVPVEVLFVAETSADHERLDQETRMKRRAS